MAGIVDEGGLHVEVLGSLEVSSADGTHLPVRGSRRRLLLATLVLHRNRHCPIDQLIDVLFGDDPPIRAAGTVQSYVSRLRHDLGAGGGQLRTGPGGYRLSIDDDHLDSARFERLVGDAQAIAVDDPARAGSLLVEGLGWWRGGRPFAEFPDDLGLQAESTRLEEIRQRAAEALVQTRLTQADHDGAINVVETCIASWPLRESFRAQQMLALYCSGRQPEALQAFRRFADELGEHGLAPTASLRELEGRILRQEPSLIVRPATPSAPVDAQGATVRRRRPGNLPLSLNALLGRQAEQDELLAHLDVVRLITLTGPGGVGKTRVAFSLAEQASSRFADGVWVCDLAGVREAALTVDAIATALDVQSRHGRSVLDGLVEVLQHRDVLVVLDNCEHLLAPTAAIVEAILRSCRGVRIVATSREPLAVDGESVWTLGPLPLPAGGETDPVMAMESPAVRLFVARATAAQPPFRLTDANTSFICQICQRLDGLPLALELAAARVRSLAPSEIADRLVTGLAILTGARRRDLRHQTLHETIAWSYQLLDGNEQTLFERLSVFASGFTGDDVACVCGDASGETDANADVLSALVDKSMVIADTRAHPSRYRLLETLRTFGREQLGENAAADRLKHRHATYIIEQVERAGAGLERADEAIWVHELEGRFDDLRVAHRWTMAQGDLDGALKLVVGLGEFAFRRMRYEVFGWVEATLAAPGIDLHRLTPLAIAIASYGRFVRGDLDQAVVLAEKSLALERRLELPPCGLNLRTLANVAYYRGDAEQAAYFARQMLQAARESGHEGRLVHALYMTSVGQASAAQPDDSRRLADEALLVALRSRNPTALASAHYAQAISVERSDPTEATSALEEAVRQGDAAQNRWIVAFARTELVSLASRRGDLDNALAIARGVIDTWHLAGDWANQWLTMRHVAGVFAQRGDFDEAAIINSAVKTASADLAMPIEASDLRRVAAIIGRLPMALGTSEHARAEARGARMTANDVVHFALASIDAALAGDRRA